LLIFLLTVTTLLLLALLLLKAELAENKVVMHEDLIQPFKGNSNQRSRIKDAQRTLASFAFYWTLQVFFLKAFLPNG
jgi:hypothetical protein